MVVDPPIRDAGRDILTRALGDERRIDALNLETTVYNHAIETALATGVARYWENVRFRSLYAQKIRSLSFNLQDPKNPALREKVLGKEVPFDRLVRMTAIELFPENWEKELAIVAAKHLRRELAEQDVHDGVFQCKKCKSWKTVYYQMQTRSADEPMTTFVTCANCHSNWKF
jgi:transcription elongation factor S-II